MEIKKKNRIIIILISILFIISFFLNLVPIRMSHFWDETVYLQHAEIFFSGRTNFDELSSRPPLISILFAFSYFIKHSVISASVITALLGALGVLFIFLVGRKLYNEKVGILAALILTFTPYIIQNSNYLLTDVPVSTLLIISFYFALFREKKLMIFLSGLFLGLSILMKFDAVLMILVFLVYFYLYRKELNRNKLILFILGFFIVMFPYFIWCQVKFGNFLEPFFTGQRAAINAKMGPILFYILNLNKVFTFLIPIGLILWFIDGIIKLNKERYQNIRADTIFLSWIIIFFIFLTFYLHYRDLRFILPITAPIILLASKGIIAFLEELKKPYKIFFVIIIIIYLVFLMTTTLGYKNLIHGNFMDNKISDDIKAAEYILNETNYTGKIYTRMPPVIAYYTGLKVQSVKISNETLVDSYLLKLMKEKGLFIGKYYYEGENYHGGDQFYKVYPMSSWMRNDSRFTFVKDIGDIFIFKYNPNITNQSIN